ncbi:MAG: hypothetical protein ACK4S4_05500 [Pyrinomonadaceae bacterium]
MRAVPASFFLLLFAGAVFSQSPANKLRYLPSAEIGKRVIERSFPDPPAAVREFHGKGNIYVLVDVSDAGKVISARSISSSWPRPVTEYVEKTVSDWNFKTLVVDGKAAGYRGVLIIRICYGAFDRTRGGLCSNRSRDEL